jgi:hypothetical protein
MAVAVFAALILAPVRMCEVEAITQWPPSHLNKSQSL